MSTQSQQQHRLAILDDYNSIAVNHFNTLLPNLSVTTFPNTLHPLHSEMDHASLIERLKPFTIISTMRERTPLPASILSQLPNLRLLLTTGTRNLGIDEKACAKLNITYCGATGPETTLPPDAKSLDSNAKEALLTEIKDLKAKNSNTNEHTWAILLALAKNVPQDDYNVKTNSDGGWHTSLITGLAGKVFGAVGLGRLGAQAAITARLGFGMRVVCWSENLTQDKADEVARSVGLPAGTFKVVSKRELFEVSDVVSLHLVLGERSRGVVGKEELGWMKKSALFVNTSRGPLVDEEALLDCCERGDIRGVALDVFDKEPLDELSRWRSTEWGKNGKTQVVLSPHMGYAEDITLHSWYKQQAENVKLWLEGKEVANRILPKS